MERIDKDIFNILLEIKASLAKVETNSDTTILQVADHSNRIDSLEKWRYLILGASLLCGFLFPTMGVRLVELAAARVPHIEQETKKVLEEVKPETHP